MSALTPLTIAIVSYASRSIMRRPTPSSAKESAAQKARNTPRTLTSSAPLLPPRTSMTQPATASAVAAYQRAESRSPKKSRPQIPATGGAAPIATIVPTATPVMRTAVKKVS